MKCTHSALSHYKRSLKGKLLFVFDRNMAEITYYLCIFLNLALTIGGTEGNHYSIYRNFSVFGDHFVIPESLCLNTTTACRKYEALNVGNSMCKCKCPHDKATFSGNGSDWKCVDDKTLRYKTGKFTPSSNSEIF